jgi:carbon monoxide dehydrogenase subunit G
MDVEKKLVVAAPAARVWELLLDPKVMGACVPGMQSIEVVSDTEYLATIHVKLAFISAKFKMRTLITEMRAPNYLCSESTGEDTSVASSLKSTTEVFVTDQGEGQTELRLKVKVDLLGRLGSFGMNAMKTKSDRMWDEFAKNLSAQLTGTATTTIPVSAPAEGTPDLVPPVVQPQSAAIAPAASVVPALVTRPLVQESWWRRLFCPRAPAHDVIHIEIRRGDTSVSVSWPQASAQECAAWLLEYLKKE